MADDEQREARRARWRRRAVYAVGALVVLAVSGVVVPRLLRPWFGRLALRRLSAELGRDVTARRVRFGLFSGFYALRLEVAQRPGVGGDALFSAREVYAKLDARALLTGRMHVTRAHVVSPTVLVVREESGAWGIDDLLSRTAWPEARCDSFRTGGVRIFLADPQRDTVSMVGVPSLLVETRPDGTTSVDATLNHIRIDELLDLLAPAPSSRASRPPIRLPELPAGLRASFRLHAGDIAYGSQETMGLSLIGSVADGIVELRELSASSGRGKLTGTGRIALGGAGGHALTVRTERLRLTRDFFEMLRRTPYLEVVDAALPFYDLLCVLTGGPPEQLGLEATMHGAFQAQGRDVAAVLASLEGEAEATLTDVEFVGSPLFRQLAVLLQQPELAKRTTFERVEAPFEVGDGRVRLHATVPYQQGALVLDGTTALAEPMAYDYRLTVRDPQGIAGIPSLVADYLAEGHPAALVGGRRGAPSLALPHKALLDYMRRRTRPDPP